MKKKRPVLQDVANKVGVTKMTVSRYLRNPDQVSAALQQKIAVALDELGYIPNRAPDILSNATSRAIGVLLPSLTNQVFAEVLRGIESVTDAHNYQTMLAHYGYLPEREEERLTSLLSFNIDGLILSERNHTPRTLKMIEVAGIPVVELMDCVTPCLDLAVGFDNFEAARQMTQQIIAHGHRHVVYLGARLDERTLIKQQGYEQAMLDAGLQPHCIMTDRASSYSSGGELLRLAQKEYPQVDSIFCTNDDLAVGAMLECQRQGLSIPQDMAIAGFHGHDIGQVMVPKLASVLTLRERMGQVAAQSLLAKLRGEAVNPRMIDTGFTLLLGGSL
ncbi:gluconate operon transcriptional repressor GntR [Serratia odorifera]|jgi:LacI family transcriptional regulator, gluconate utilization system Gnt-I transcriptional repressor|uniref:HTH-type transcriptional regulator GntR n=2 Tax=Serratia odorifera TaxID=618 RepID=D4DYR9_SEROD|nr:gluconate operon transcriptional repressor GntR [Serratia odorifera]EFE97241.1 HTH-type transcriptional regulator GntR [Serratia odorifera DSM 4582]MBJ2066625.1 gluconate operon transcriptional repressor GntR [Serratia odorifera]PNK91794.1 LacI family DNA-binding transcriptional regulator [Serratia odorifera]RII72870.1 HTH-type transcriptional regulator GntR [Serratia odorifera]HEJ9096449.1 gluconate operon transcriptional repressor GntR [Serratia odorifera]